MDDNIIGRFLSNELLHKSNTMSSDPQPKLRRFIHHGESIQCSRVLGRGEHGVVLLASIEGAEYALKIFEQWKQPGPVFYPYDQAIYTSPLANESRAFARLDSRNENGTWAARCFGWMKLSDPQFKKIREVINTNGLSRWVVVKEYLPMSTKPSDIRKIFTNFEIPREARIMPQDVRIENYRGSKIVDLSSALTDPCPGWSEFLFEYFNKETVYGIFDWFEGQTKESLSTSQRPLTRAFAFILRPFCVLAETR